MGMPEPELEQSEHKKLVQAVSGSVVSALPVCRPGVVSSQLGEEVFTRDPEGVVSALPVCQAAGVPAQSSGEIHRMASSTHAFIDRPQAATRTAVSSSPRQALVGHSSLPAISDKIATQMTSAVTAAVRTEVRKGIDSVSGQIAAAQERHKAYFEELSARQRSLERAISEVYCKGFQAEGEILNHILRELKRGCKERARIVEIVESLRRWAKSVQRSLPSDASLRAAVERLAEPEDRISLYQYIEANFPLIPGLIHYKVEIGSEHKADLQELWREIKQLWGGKAHRASQFQPLATSNVSWPGSNTAPR